MYMLYIHYYDHYGYIIWDVFFRMWLIYVWMVWHLQWLNYHTISNNNKIVWNGKMLISIDWKNVNESEIEKFEWLSMLSQEIMGEKKYQNYHYFRSWVTFFPPTPCGLNFLSKHSAHLAHIHICFYESHHRLVNHHLNWSSYECYVSSLERWRKKSGHNEQCQWL